MNKFREKLIRFMEGRYGVDSLNRGLTVLWGIFFAVNLFARSTVLDVLELAALGLLLFRTLSRNHPARRAENGKFLHFWNPMKSRLQLQRDRLRDVKTTRYRTCPHCKAIIKLPNRRGKHTVVCPRCRERFDVHIL